MKHSSFCAGCSEKYDRKTVIIFYKLKCNDWEELVGNSMFNVIA
ncbi:hypothetical protein HMPREF1870_02632 [Bacteroidales bacterium KA00344]|nr:hypothetical protein HMPREF1870_02632 [Bacteroidales bacterium KA00344]